MLECAAEDEGAGELGECEVELGSAFPAGADAALVVEPGVGALDHRALARLRVARSPLARFALVWDARLDPAFAQRGADVGGVVAAVGEQQVGAVAAIVAQRRDRVDERDEMAAVVVVCGAEKNRERQPAAVAG
jgi:hypothetical protein